MTLALIVVGAAAWGGVVILSLLMAAWEQPVWGFLPIVAAVVVAWAIGEYVTGALLNSRRS
jgi:hypothetical protein